MTSSISSSSLIEQTTVVEICCLRHRWCCPMCWVPSEQIFSPNFFWLDCVSKAKKTDPITKWTRQEIVSSTFFWVSWSQQGWQTGVEQPRDEVVALLLLYHVKKCGTHDVRTQGIPTYSVQLAKNVIWDAFTLQLPRKIRNKRESQQLHISLLLKEVHSGKNPFKMCHATPRKLKWDIIFVHCDADTFGNLAPLPLKMPLANEIERPCCVRRCSNIMINGCRWWWLAGKMYSARGKGYQIVLSSKEYQHQLFYHLAPTESNLDEKYTWV